tara:strand:- start:601 stop:1017 length:417 start_codon:yes stop_codon:yes gene_type:complete
MDKALNQNLYKDVVSNAKKKFDRWPSAYASMWVQKEYQNRGGKYKGKKNTKNLNKWVKEKWIQILPLLQDKKIIECGSDNKDSKVCRPIVRVNKDTPITIQELLELHSVKDLIKLAKKKNDDMKGRVYWKNLKFIPYK